MFDRGEVAIDFHHRVRVGAAVIIQESNCIAVHLHATVGRLLLIDLNQTAV